MGSVAVKLPPVAGDRFFKNYCIVVCLRIFGLGRRSAFQKKHIRVMAEKNKKNLPHPIIGAQIHVDKKSSPAFVSKVSQNFKLF